MDNAISVLSLVVAILAASIGPLISWIISKRQLAASLEVANKQIVAPMRQNWINDLRELMAELTSSALNYYVAGFEERTDDKYRRLMLLEHKIALMLNPLEDDHKQLEQLIRQMVSALERGRESEEEFVKAYQAVMNLSRQILKREWNRVKDRIQLT